MSTPLALAVFALSTLALQPVPCGCGGSHTPAPQPAGLAWEVVSVRSHDRTAWTQGLQLDPEGRLFESTGLRGRSTLREVDPRSGEVVREVDLPDDQFAEGLAMVGDRLIQLTWQEGLANVWEAETFESLGAFDYDGEGWGLCFDGERLVMSDGSQQLTLRDPATFEVTGTIDVQAPGLPPLRLNELECVGDTVWANAWLTDLIVRIDPVEGRVTGILDLDGLLERWGPSLEESAALEPPDVLNGIAWDEAAGTFLVTGKRWPALFEIRVEEGSPISSPEPAGTALASPRG